MVLYAGTRGWLDRREIADIGTYETELYRFLERRHPALLNALADKKHIDDRITAILDAVLQEFATVLGAPQVLAAA